MIVMLVVFQTMCQQWRCADLAMVISAAWLPNLAYLPQFLVTSVCYFSDKALHPHPE